MKTQLFNAIGGACALLVAAGCTTMRLSDTSRTGKEQLLISNAVDQVLNKVDFASLRGRRVYVEEKYLDCVDKGYITGSIRHRVLNAGARLVDKADEADVVMEVRSGGVGTDNSESYVGMPEIALPGPMPVQLPEVKLWSRSSQFGTAKLAIVAYDARERYVVNHGGHALARSDDSNWYVLGVGPFQTGSVRDEVRLATGTGGQLARLTNSAFPTVNRQPPPQVPAGQAQPARVAMPPQPYPTTDQLYHHYR